MRKIYIAGPVTGLPILATKQRFDSVENNLHFTGLYEEVINPVKFVYENDLEDQSWETIMQALLPELLRCDSIYLLHGWQRSKGARVEYSIAKVLGYTIFSEKTKPNGKKRTDDRLSAQRRRQVL